MKYSFIINKKLIRLNEYTNASRYNKYKKVKQKKDVKEYIIWKIKKQLGSIKIDKPVMGHFVWIEENKRLDLDNICFAKKFILDVLVEAGILKEDNRKIVTNFFDSFQYSDKSIVIVELEEM